jgi:predicted nucleotidyltransferase
MADHLLSPKHLAIIRATLAPYAASIDKVGLFGSRATGAGKSNSDIDLVLYGALDQRTLDEIYTLFAESALPVTVDAQAYNLIEYPPLKAHIDRCAHILFTQEELLKDNFYS